MNKLIEAVREYQKEEGLTDTGLTQLIGLDRSTWAYIKAGKRNPGVKFLRAISLKLPQFRALIYEEITDNTSAPQTTQNQHPAGFRGRLVYFIGRFKKLLANSREL